MEANDVIRQTRWMALVEVIEQLSLAGSMDDVAYIIRSRARKLSGADGVTFVLRDGDFCHYVDEDAIGPLWKGRRFPMVDCISGWCMVNKQTAIIPDIYADPRIPHDAYRPTFVKSLVMVPVRVDDPLAAIGTYWSREHTPDAETVAMLEALARSTAMSIANLWLRQSLSELRSQIKQLLRGPTDR